MSAKKYLLIFAVIGFVVFGNALGNGFVWDDEEMILNNPAVHSLSNLPAFFQGSTFNSGGAGSLSGLYYKPLMIAAFSAIYTFFGPNAAVFHLVQILLHIGSAFFLFLVLQYLFKSDPVPLAISLIFLVHPANAETVVYIADYQEVLFFFFGIAALWYILTRPVVKIYYLAPLLAASFLSKETGLVMAVITGVAVYFFARDEAPRPDGRGIFSLLLRLPASKAGRERNPAEAENSSPSSSDLRPRFSAKGDKLKVFICSFLTALATYAFLRFTVAGIFFNKHGLTPMSVASLPARLVNIPSIIFFYLKTFFYPAVLTINQQWIVAKIDLPAAVIDLLFFAALGAGFLFVRAKKLYLFFLVWFLLGLGLHLQIFPLDLTVSDRWFYLPEVGLLGMSGVLAAGVNIKSPKLRSLILYSLFLILAVLSLRTFRRTFNWRDGYTLYGHDIKTSPDAFDLQNNYGVELFRRGNYAAAKAHFEKSVTLSPQWWTNWNNLGAVAERDGHYNLAREFYQKAIDHGHYYLAYENLAKLLYFRFSQTDGIRFAQDSLRFLPYNPTLRAIASAQY